MKEISQSDFATSLGLSRAAISLSIKRGNLKISESGKIDLDDNQTIAYLKKREIKTSEKPEIIQKKEKKPKEIKIKPEKPKKNIIPTYQEQIEILSEPIPESSKPIIVEHILPKKTNYNDSDNVEDVVINQTLPIDQILELQEYFKARKYREEVLAKELQRKQIEKQLIDVDMARFLFFSFMEQMKTELSVLPHKQSPNLESLYKSGQAMKAEQLMLREYESVIESIIKDQKKALTKWVKEKE